MSAFTKFLSKIYKTEEGEFLRKIARDAFGTDEPSSLEEKIHKEIFSNEFYKMIKGAKPTKYKVVLKNFESVSSLRRSVFVPEGFRRLPGMKAEFVRTFITLLAFRILFIDDVKDLFRIKGRDAEDERATLSLFLSFALLKPLAEVELVGPAGRYVKEFVHIGSEKVIDRRGTKSPKYCIFIDLTSKDLTSAVGSAGAEKELDNIFVASKGKKVFFFISRNFCEYAEKGILYPILFHEMSHLLFQDLNLLRKNVFRNPDSGSPKHPTLLFLRNGTVQNIISDIVANVYGYYSVLRLQKGLESFKKYVEEVVRDIRETLVRKLEDAFVDVLFHFTFLIGGESSLFPEDILAEIREKAGKEKSATAFVICSAVAKEIRANVSSWHSDIKKIAKDLFDMQINPESFKKELRNFVSFLFPEELRETSRGGLNIVKVVKEVFTQAPGMQLININLSSESIRKAFATYAYIGGNLIRKKGRDISATRMSNPRLYLELLHKGIGSLILPTVVHFFATKRDASILAGLQDAVSKSGSIATALKRASDSKTFSEFLRKLGEGIVQAGAQDSIVANILERKVFGNTRRNDYRYTEEFLRFIFGTEDINIREGKIIATPSRGSSRLNVGELSGVVKAFITWLNLFFVLSEIMEKPVTDVMEGSIEMLEKVSPKGNITMEVENILRHAMEVDTNIPFLVKILTGIAIESYSKKSSGNLLDLVDAYCVFKVLTYLSIMPLFIGLCSLKVCFGEENPYQNLPRSGRKSQSGEGVPQEVEGEGGGKEEGEGERKGREGKEGRGEGEEKGREGGEGEREGGRKGREEEGEEREGEEVGIGEEEEGGEEEGEETGTGEREGEEEEEGEGEGKGEEEEEGTEKEKEGEKDWWKDEEKPNEEGRLENEEEEQRGLEGPEGRGSGGEGEGRGEGRGTGQGSSATEVQRVTVDTKTVEKTIDEIIKKHKNFILSIPLTSFVKTYAWTFSFVIRKAEAKKISGRTRRATFLPPETGEEKIKVDFVFPLVFPQGIVDTSGSMFSPETLGAGMECLSRIFTGVVVKQFGGSRNAFRRTAENLEKFFRARQGSKGILEGKDILQAFRLVDECSRVYFVDTEIQSVEKMKFISSGILGKEMEGSNISSLLFPGEVRGGGGTEIYIPTLRYVINKVKNRGEEFVPILIAGAVLGAIYEILPEMREKPLPEVATLITGKGMENEEIVTLVELAGLHGPGFPTPKMHNDALKRLEASPRYRRIKELLEQSREGDIPKEVQEEELAFALGILIVSPWIVVTDRLTEESLGQFSGIERYFNTVTIWCGHKENKPPREFEKGIFGVELEGNTLTLREIKKYNPYIPTLSELLSLGRSCL